MNKAPLLRDTRDNATMTVKITKDSTSATIKEDYLKAQNRIIELEGIVENLLYKSKTQIYKDEKPKTKSTSTFTAETPTKSASTFTIETPTKSISTSTINFSVDLTSGSNEEMVSQLQERIEHLKDCLDASQKAHIKGMQEMNALKIQYSNETKAIDELVVTYENEISALKNELVQIETNADKNKVEKRDSDFRRSVEEEALVFKSKELEVQLNNMTQMKNEVDEQVRKMTIAVDEKDVKVQDLKSQLLEKRECTRRIT